MLDAGKIPGDVRLATRWALTYVDRGDRATPNAGGDSSRASRAGSSKRIILCAPPAEQPDITVVFGVNDDGVAARITGSSRMRRAPLIAWRR